MPTSEKSRDAQKSHIQRTEAYTQEVKAQYIAAVEEMAELCKRLPKLDTGQMFSFDATTARQRSGVQSALRRLHAANVASIHEGSRKEWSASNDATDALLRTAIGKSAMEDPALAGWMDRGERAEEAFMKRSDEGMDLSDRIWRNVRQFRDEMEVAMTVAIGEGASAQSMSRTIRKYLNDPDMMFRRFRYKDEDGQWQRKWKKKVIGDDGKVRFIDYDRDSYRTGAGVYKSSYRNAMRVARTETNMAYRQADHDRWQRLDFILGQRIELSNAHTEDDEDICNELAGDYPRDFTFTGWHPQCMCFCTPITADEEDVLAAAKARMEGKDYTLKGKPVTTYPKGFRDFVTDNKEALRKAIARGKAPYFVTENRATVEGMMKGSEPSKLGDVIDRVKGWNIATLDVSRRDVPRSHDAIVRRLGGRDRTKGSCASLSLAYAGNRAGYDVLDFRGGSSLNYFATASHLRTLFETVGGVTERHASDYKACAALFGTMEADTEYILVTGRHASVVTKDREGKMQYLELQDDESRNGYHPLDDGVLKRRFGCQASHRKAGIGRYEAASFVVPVSALGEDPGFGTLLSYINTDEGKQQKGAGGRIR